ncbi:F-box/kelch-repeat protein At1g57790-like [Papaver somniferum]|uniref:F-box/kelch-repeat protein At1g57790-like n=1 Tax=Papaver somniferum TaxID=3469 RepID=UPI000E6FED80|nr:F-box/kelch-repeat protein At1g57790-like [Papaver somniferum]
MYCKVENFTTFNFVNPIDNSMSYQYVLYDLEQNVVRFQKEGVVTSVHGKSRFQFILFNPFTKATINSQNCQFSAPFLAISFSSLPTSPDCIVFAITQDMDGQVRIYFIKKGEAFWSSCPFANTDADKYIPPLNTPVFYNGDFYSVDYNGSLAVFKVDGNGINWKVLEKPHKPFDSIYPSFLVECDRELLLVKMGRLGTLFGIFRLDSSRMDWIKIENLGKFMLFVSHTSCFSVIAPPNSRMKNKVYFPRLCMNGEGVLFYCLETGSYRSFGSRHSASDFSDTQGWYFNCTWIQENNRANSTDQELDWVKCPSSRASSTSTSQGLVNGPPYKKFT